MQGPIQTTWKHPRIYPHQVWTKSYQVWNAPTSVHFVFCFPLRNQALLAMPNPHSSPGALILQPSQQSHHSPFSEQVIQYMRLTCRQLGRSFLLSTSQGTASISSSPPFPSADSFLSRSVLGEAGSSMFADLPVGARLLQHCAGKIVFRKLPAKSRTPVLHYSPSLITCCFHDLPLTACIVTGVAVHWGPFLSQEESTCVGWWHFLNLFKT